MHGVPIAGMKYEPQAIIAFALYVQALESGATEPEALSDKIDEMLVKGALFISHCERGGDPEMAKLGAGIVNRHATLIIHRLAQLPGNN
jgi:hypothetical protein